MEDHLENFGEEDMDEVVENTDEKRGLDGNLGANGSEKRGLVGNIGADGTEKRWPGWPGESVFRILVSSQKIGGIIGRKGEIIKKMCEESRARIKILDGPQGVPERAVMISAKEEQDASISPAMDGLLKVHKRTVDGLDNDPSLAPSGNMVFTRLLVPATQAGSLIGKHGATIKSIQEGSNCIICILEDLPPVALHDDRVVEIQGEPIGVHKAVELISCHLRKFLVDRSVLALFEMQMQMPPPPPPMNQNFPPPQPWGPPHRPPNTAGPFYGGNPGYGAHPVGYGGNPSHGGNPGYGGNPSYGNPPFMPPPRPHDNFYPPPEVPPFEKPPHHGMPTYGGEAPVVGAAPAIQQPSPSASHLTQHMQIPLSYADAVIGNAGANISYIRRASGATVAIQESRGVPGEMTAEITGSATQVQAAQQLIQNFMAEAAAPATTAAPANPLAQPDQAGYSNSYPSVYSAPPAYPAGADGTNYGY